MPDSSSTPLGTRSVARRPVVLVHGIWNTAQIFAPLKTYLEIAEEMTEEMAEKAVEETGRSVYTFSMTPNNGDAPIEVLAQQVAEFVYKSLGPQQPFDLVGFSMGGLVSRYYLQRLGGLARVKTFVAVSVPHYGTALAFGSDRTGVRQMRPFSPFLSALNQDIHRLSAIQVWSFWTIFDLLILPPWSSKLNIGTTRRLNIVSHNRMIRDSQGLAAIASALSGRPPENTAFLQTPRWDKRNV